MQEAREADQAFATLRGIRRGPRMRYARRTQNSRGTALARNHSPVLPGRSGGPAHRLHQATPSRSRTRNISTGAQRQAASVVAVIDEEDADAQSQGEILDDGHRQQWETEPSDMLKQVADIELPQMFEAYERSTHDL